MKLTKFEKDICKKYSRRDKEGRVHCPECPLAVKTYFSECKRTMTDEEWRAYIVYIENKR